MKTDFYGQVQELKAEIIGTIIKVIKSGVPVPYFRYIEKLDKLEVQHITLGWVDADSMTVGDLANLADEALN